MVSEFDSLLLEHVVFSDDLDFCIWEMLQQGGSQHILGCFDIDWNKSSTNNEDFLWRLIFSCAGFSTFAYFELFS